MNCNNDNNPKPNPRKLPPWLKRRMPASAKLDKVVAILDELSLVTVCQSADCPNRGECFAKGTATFMILGDHCTRNCRFCAVPTAGNPPAPRCDEPQAVAEACSRLGLKHVVITSVTRDDLPDGGAEHFARTIRAIQDTPANIVVEVLTPDFLGRTRDVDTVLDAEPDVFNHNVETVARLYDIVRPQADYRRSLNVLTHAAQRPAGDKRLYVKSGLMVGLGETSEEVTATMQDMRNAGCDMLTIGQYLAPSSAHLKVEAFIEPAQFDLWRDQGIAMGFVAVAAAPFVRSSYQAEQFFDGRSD